MNSGIGTAGRGVPSKHAYVKCILEIPKNLLVGTKFQMRKRKRERDMERGYVKLWRKTLDGGMLGNQKLWAFWCWCLLKETHKQVKQIVGFQEIILEPGQLVFGRKKADKELKMSEQSVRTIVLNLKNHEKLTIKTTANILL